VPAVRRPDGLARSGARNPVATEPVLGLSEVRPALLDNLPHPARCRSPLPGRRSQTAGGMTSVQGIPMFPSLHPDDEDDEVLEDEEFDEDAEADDEDDDLESDDEEEEETWQVSRLDFVG
jgi:hypothetical protein